MLGFTLSSVKLIRRLNRNQASYYWIFKCLSKALKSLNHVLTYVLWVLGGASEPWAYLVKLSAGCATKQYILSIETIEALLGRKYVISIFLNTP